MIYTVTFNPALDYVMVLDNEINFDDINRSTADELYFGGKGINVSVILNRLGVETKALGFVAGFTGDKIKEMLDEDGVKTDFIKLKNGITRINVKIKSNVELDVNAKGPDITNADIEKLYEKFEMLKSGDFLVLAGSIPESLPSNVYERIMKSLSGKGVEVVVDATGDLLKNVLKYKPFLVKPNHHELGEIFGKELTTEDEIIYYAKELQKLGAKNVLVSRAKDGAILIDENGNVSSTGIVKGKPVNSVGCGDSMVAGFVAGYIEKNDYNYALKLGSAAGNATAFSYSLATKDEIENILNNYFNK